MTDEDPDTCAAKACGPNPKPVAVRFDHPLYSSKYGTCEEHEPSRCSSCDGHILNGECHC